MPIFMYCDSWYNNKSCCGCHYVLVYIVTYSDDFWWWWQNNNDDWMVLFALFHLCSNWRSVCLQPLGFVPTSLRPCPWKHLLLSASGWFILVLGGSCRLKWHFKKILCAEKVGMFELHLVLVGILHFCSLHLLFIYM